MQQCPIALLRHVMLKPHAASKIQGNCTENQEELIYGFPPFLLFFAGSLLLTLFQRGACQSHPIQYLLCPRWVDEMCIF